MTKRIILNAFDMTTTTHQSSGTWRHPDSQAHRYKDLDYWTNLAQTLERGRFDSIFIADVLGTYDVFRGSAAAALRDGAQTPVNDPFLQVPAMAAVTKHLGFGVTAAVTYDQPFPFARRIATLDHLTKGRVAWNVVTSYLNSAALNHGFTKQLGHDDRYELAEEFLDVVYKLLEGSWDDDAVVFDQANGIFADPAKVHPIKHEGTHFSVPGFAITEPSPQRTPVIFQAGASPRGRTFAASHGEGVFISPATPEGARVITDDIRDRAEAQGRSRDDVKIFALVTVVTDENDAKAIEKLKDYLSYASPEGVLALYGGWTGIDYSKFDRDQPLEAVDNDSLRSVLASLASSDNTVQWTVNDIVSRRGIGGMGPVIVGGPETVADELERWVEVGGLDGFNFAYAVTPGSFEDLVDYVVPELQRRGRAQTEYTGTTLREGLYGEGQSRVLETHPAARYRGAFSETVEDAEDREFAL
ncbi:LLM class flavin-dependent oxidoreductase [Gulosibacter sediminis]|uniref:LLM class flavin-dependent oxidoreductase n=1 Tax=Gulosibacter sediminis TaxID=1729695 RepID=UPI0024AE0F87|nr:LLM class flavin-dependent oxidoreductase [Gulosibacter sediminis]